MLRAVCALQGTVALQVLSVDLAALRGFLPLAWLVIIAEDGVRVGTFIFLEEVEALPVLQARFRAQLVARDLMGLRRQLLLPTRPVTTCVAMWPALAIGFGLEEAVVFPTLATGTQVAILKSTRAVT